MRKTRKFDIGGSTSFSPEQEKWLGKADRTDPYILARMRRAVPDRQAPAPVEDRVAKPVPDDIYGKAAPESKSDGSFDALEKKRFTPSESKSDGSFDALEAKRLSSPAPTKVPREEMGDANVAQRANDSPSSAPPASTDKGARDTQRLAKAPAAKPAAKAPSSAPPASTDKGARDTQRLAKAPAAKPAAKAPAAKPAAKAPAVEPKPASAAKPVDETKLSLSERMKLSRERAKSSSTGTDTRPVGQRIRESLGMKKGGGVKGYASGGSVSSRADGIAQRGKTRCRVC